MQNRFHATHRQLAWLTALLLSLAHTTSCTNLKNRFFPSKDALDAQQEASSQDPTHDQDAEDGAAAAIPFSTLDEIQPRIVPIAPNGEAPYSVVIEFHKAALPDGTTINLSESDLSIKPEVDGNWARRNASSIEFRPQQGFAPDTTFTVAINSLIVGKVTLNAQKPTTATFTTPQLTLKRAEFIGIRNRGQNALVRLTLSGALNPNRLRTQLTWLARPGQIRSVAYQNSSYPFTALSPHEVIAVLWLNPASAPLKEIELATTGSSGLLSAKQFRIPVATQDSISHIRSIALKEGTSGHYLEIECLQTPTQLARSVANSNEETNNEDEWSESPRKNCALTESALGSLRIEPPTPLSLVPTGNGFRLFGKFPRDHIRLTILRTAPTLSGQPLGQTVEWATSVSLRSPTLNLGAQGRYLPKTAWKSLPLHHRNLDQGFIEVRHIPAENLIFWMSDSSERAGPRTSNLISRKQISLKNPIDEDTTTWLNLQSLLKIPDGGVIELATYQADPAHGYPSPSDMRRILFTNMNIIAKRSHNDSVQVWILDTESGRTLDGVSVQQIAASGRTISECSTANAKGCTLAALDKDSLDRSPPFAIIAQKGNDITYLKYAELRTQIDEGAIQGRPYAEKSPYRAAIYSDRGVYRPGETAHLVAVLRDREGVAPTSSMPLVMQIQDARGKTIKKLTLSTNTAGVVNADLNLAPFAVTGSYSTQIVVANREAGSTTFKVEEFVPERMRVNGKFAQDNQLTGEANPLHIEARYLFGGSAKGSPYEILCEVQPAPFVPKSKINATFGVELPPNKNNKAIPIGKRNGVVGEDGSVSDSCEVKSESVTFPGTARITARIAVMEAGSGRATRAQASALVHPEKYAIGLKSKHKKAHTGQPIKVEGQLVDWVGEPHKGIAEVSLEVFRVENEYIWSYEENDGWSMRRFERMMSEGSKTVKVDGWEFATEVTVQETGSAVIIRATAGRTRTDLRIEGEGSQYWWQPGEARFDQTPRPNKPTWLTLEVAEATEVNKSTEVRFNAPYRGWVLLSAESDTLLTHEWIEVDEPGPVEWDFAVDSFVPNVYVSAFMVKDPKLESSEAFLPDRAFGVQSVRIIPREFTSALKLTAATETRPNSMLEVHLDVDDLEPGSVATVAVVDEGVLQLTRFKNPDPLAILFDKRALAVETFETIGWNLVMPPSGTDSATGGDAGDELAAPGRVQPIKPVALWSGIVAVPEDGKLTLPFIIPQYRGELRIMAVVMGPKRIGTASATTTVRDPITLQTTTPRFLVQGDRVHIPVFVTNTTGKHQSITVRATIQPYEEEPLPNPQPIEFVGSKESTIELADEASAPVVFQVKATGASGAITLAIQANAGKIESRDSADIPLHPASPPETIIQKITLKPGTTELKLTGWVPMTEQTSVLVTGNPYADALRNAKYLIQYPYGCIEQTTSSTRPLLHLADSYKQIMPKEAKKQPIEDMILTGVDRIISMQTPAGGFSYWPGGTDPTPWASAFATHLLLDARQANFAVPDEALAAAIKYIEITLTHHIEDSRGHLDAHHSGAEPYLQYVLARSGRGRKARILELLSERNTTNHLAWAQDRYLLQTALYLAGDRRFEDALRAIDEFQPTPGRSNDWTFYSHRRALAMAATLHHDLFGDTPALRRVADSVASQMTQHSPYWYSTQELVWGVDLLGRLSTGGATTFTAALTRGGAEVDPDHFPAEKGQQGETSPERVWSLYRASEQDDLAVSLSGKTNGNVYAIVASQGVREKPSLQTGNNGLQVWRTYYRPDGTPLSTETPVLLGDTLVVEIAIKNQLAAPLNNVALVDRIPAGLEIENPRLGQSTATIWIETDTLWEPEHLNIRDHRIEYFGRLEPRQTRRIYYAVRATLAGDFTTPFITAEAMYDPQIWARERGERFHVTAPWEKEKP